MAITCMFHCLIACCTCSGTMAPAQTHNGLQTFALLAAWRPREHCGSHAAMPHAESAPWLMIQATHTHVGAQTAGQNALIPHAQFNIPRTVSVGRLFELWVWRQDRASTPATATSADNKQPYACFFIRVCASGDKSCHPTTLPPYPTTHSWRCGYQASPALFFLSSSAASTLFRPSIHPLTLCLCRSLEPRASAPAPACTSMPRPPAAATLDTSVLCSGICPKPPSEGEASNFRLAAAAKPGGEAPPKAACACMTPTNAEYWLPASEPAAILHAPVPATPIPPTPPAPPAPVDPLRCSACPLDP